MPTTAWGRAPTSGTLKTNTLRYGVTSQCGVRSTSDHLMAALSGLAAQTGDFLRTCFFSCC